MDQDSFTLRISDRWAKGGWSVQREARRVLKRTILRFLRIPPVKGLLYRSLSLSGAVTLARRRNQGGAVILTYHGVGRRGSGGYLDRACIEEDVFEEQMRWLRRHYSLLPLSELVAGLEGRTSLPPLAAAVTFDDGFKNNFTVAHPILSRLGIPATIFLTTSHIGQKGGRLWTDRVDVMVFSCRKPRIYLRTPGGWMGWDVSGGPARVEAAMAIRAHLKSLPQEQRWEALEHLREQAGPVASHPRSMEERYEFLDWEDVERMAQEGIEFGSHSHSHPILARLGPREMERELLESKMAIESRLGRPCELFSYPNGLPTDFSRREESVLRRLGFRAATTQIPGFNLPGSNPFQLKRINIPRSRSLAYFKALLSGIGGQLVRV